LCFRITFGEKSTSTWLKQHWNHHRVREFLCVVCKETSKTARQSERVRVMTEEKEAYDTKERKTKYLFEWWRRLEEKAQQMPANERNRGREEGFKATGDNRESLYVSIRETAINFWEVTGMLTENTIFLIQSLYLLQTNASSRTLSFSRVLWISLFLGSIVTFPFLRIA